LVQKPDKIQPALIGGLVIGVLWAIPFLNLLNYCCCIGVLLGGALAANRLINRSPVLPVSNGDGAVVGLLAGLIGAGVHLVLGVPLALLFNEAGLSFLQNLLSQVTDPKAREMLDQAIRQSQSQGMAERLVAAVGSWLFISVVSIGFATLGGLIGVAMFEKRKGPPYPMQPPPGYPPPGYPPGGGYPPQPPPSAPYGTGPSNQ
jgi:hypothetical protein